MEMNAPLDCLCGYVVSDDKQGVIDLAGKFHAYVSA